jgi:hypothetical protein
MNSKYIKENANDVVHHLEYNAERTHYNSRITVGICKNSKLPPEANIQDEVERNKAAKYIIQVMGGLNPHLRDVLDFQHKFGLAFLMSDFSCC